MGWDVNNGKLIRTWKRRIKDREESYTEVFSASFDGTESSIESQAWDPEQAKVCGGGGGVGEAILHSSFVDVVQSLLVQ